MLKRLSSLGWLLLIVACGARTDVPGGEDELDGSVADVGVPDSTFPDVKVDVSPPPPPPDDAQPPPPPPPPDDAEPPPPPPDDAGPPPPPPDDGGPPECNVTCKHNHDCQQQCPGIGPSERWCCDEQTEICYAFAGKHCPGIVDAGFD